MDGRSVMGFADPAAQRIPMPVGHLKAMNLALWRSKVGWEIIVRAATEILDRCRHVSGCPGAESATEPCPADRFEERRAPRKGARSKRVLVAAGCPDRELRMSALVALNAARMFAPINAKRIAQEPYMAPSREYFSEVIAELAAAQAELEMLRAQLLVEPPPNPEPEPQIESPQLKLLPEDNTT